MGIERTDLIKRRSAEIVQELLENVNGLWRELTLKSKPKEEFVESKISKIKNILDELRQKFLKGRADVGK